MITIAGAGVAGLACAFELARRGADVTVYETGAGLADNRASWLAGGMLAPGCEGETAPAEVTLQGAGAIDWWAQHTPVERRGTLVVAPPRDRAELDRFARRTQGHHMVTGPDLDDLEPALAGRFQRGLFFAHEAHLDPRRALADLASAVVSLGGRILYGTPAPARVDVDCRGMAAQVPGLRAVRGEMALVDAPDLRLTRVLRLLHPRIPLYVVPRGGGVYMIGATMVESDSARAVTVRSLLELLGAAFALHPAFGEATVIETGAGLRPAFDDNLPTLKRLGDTVHVNGLYRHGFLMAPALARRLAQSLLEDPTDEHSRERRTA